MEEIIQFNNEDGHRLVGVVHKPDAAWKKLGIVFVHAGVQGRHGNINQYVYYARELCGLGYLCMRFDSYGLGDSEGLIDPMDMRDYYGSIQTGRYVKDTLRAIDEIKKLGVERVLLFGLCGGAITALLAAPFSRDVAGMMLLSAPTVLDSSKINYDIRIPRELASTHLKGYVNKLFKPKYWKRFLSFKSDYAGIWRYIRALFRKKETKEPSSNGDRIKRPGGNRYFFESYDACKNRSRILWIFGSNDSFWYDFKKEFYDKNLMGGDDRLVLVENANHMFTLLEWQRKIASDVTGWLEECFDSGT